METVCYRRSVKRITHTRPPLNPMSTGFSSVWRLREAGSGANPFRVAPAIRYTGASCKLPAGIRIERRLRLCRRNAQFAPPPLMLKISGRHQPRDRELRRDGREHLVQARKRDGVGTYRSLSRVTGIMHGNGEEILRQRQRSHSLHRRAGSFNSAGCGVGAASCRLGAVRD